ncbi:cell division protease FtsH [Caldalkalibacillus uzonensis]|uniref:ATP-dependent zinc metalloprotease FtsH n=1 Tax=Caldalkalibacillus uzonensis TaxID=353224 RepID=A0ABU0CW56_9BACI|nr:ATP-dependent zinc metalloprotease FtsH [Caldalkalibacillus uzonensis]MDQ0340657.1 cell division protease FtsH [Caldalkalibacillus uzonensis]
MSRFFRNTAFYLLIFLVVVGLFSFLSDNREEAQEINYHQFIQYLEDGRVDKLHVQADRGVWYIEGEYESAVGDTTRFYTYAPMNFNEVIERINQAGVNLTYEPAPGDPIWLTFFTTLIPFLLIFILFFFLMSQAQGGGNKVMNFGKSKAKLIQEDKKKVTFKDVAGADEEKQELEEIVQFLKDPRKFSQLGARIPKGVLLVGPPGTGKTLLGRAVAGEAGVPFFSISGSDFVEMFVGVGASRVRDLFENAKKNAPCIIFIDEIDAVGRQRGAGLGGGHDEREQTLNQLLVEMDGFEANEGIIIMAATNRPDVLDPALLRPGRFDRQITVDRPDIRGRVEVLKVHARNKPLATDVDLEVIAKRTPGFAGADLENLLNEAALLAARRNKKEISMTEVDDAIDRVIAGTEKRSRRVSEKERKIVAYHESGHTIAGYFLPNADLVHKVTIVPRGQAGGYMVPIPKEERFIYTEPELKDRIAGLLGGRVAEEIVFGEVSVGATDDFRKATGLARRMVTEFGMSKLGPLQFGESQGQVFLGRDIGHERNYSEQIAYEIDQEVRRIINEQYERCKELLIKYRDKLEQVAQTLLEVETLTADQIKEVIETGKLSSKPFVDKEKQSQESRQPETDHNGGATEAKEDVKVHIHSKKEEAYRPQDKQETVQPDEPEHKDQPKKEE